MSSVAFITFVRSAMHADSILQFGLQDDEYLYLVMEYLAGGDVMVRPQSSGHSSAYSASQ